MKFFYYFLIFICPSFVFVIESHPWFGNPYEFDFLSKYSYSHFSSVDSSVDPLKNASDDHLVLFDLGFTFAVPISLDMDLEIVDTPRQPFGFRSCAFQGRYLFYNDIIGDCLTLSAGGNIRVVSADSLRDISSPYSSNVNFEATVALGKELFSGFYWKIRVWGLGAAGIANRGSPWVRSSVYFELNSEDNYNFAVFFNGLHGYGKKTVVDIDHFYGYGSIREKNGDVGIKITRKLGVFGSLGAEYKRRLYAKSCPENVNTFEVSYFLPFSF
jgi:hypothetical protein